ncbi:MAG: hypothetical protein AAFX09_01875 [Pseudomonadota bacterium]
MDIIDSVISLLREGFYQVNAVQGLIIALVAAFLIGGWRRLPAFALGAALVHVLVDTLLPVLSAGAALTLPPLVELGFWRYFVTLIIGYLIVIAVLMLLKRVLLRR